MSERRRFLAVGTALAGWMSAQVARAQGANAPGAMAHVANGQGESAARPTLPAGASGPARLAPVQGRNFEAFKPADGLSIRLSVWRKQLQNPADALPGPRPPAPFLFVHGSSTAGRASFDLQVPGKPQYSAMDWFARRGYDVWCFDHEGYGSSDKRRDINADVATGADDIAAVCDLIRKETGAAKVMMYGISSGSLRAALYAERHPDRVARLALDALVWTGQDSPTLAKRRLQLDEWRAHNRRPLTRALVESIFTRDHPGTADPDVVRAFADALTGQDNSVPTGTYLDMCANLPVNDPTRLPMPTIVMRGEFDGIASFADVLAFFAKLPNADKHFAVMAGIAHSSMHEKNSETLLAILDSFLRQPPPRYLG